MDKLSDTPSWVRWVLVAPLALAAATAAYFGVYAFVAIVSLVGLSSSVQYYLTQIVGAIAQPLAFVVVGTKVAPTRHFGVAVALTGFYAVVATAILISIISSDPGPGPWAIAAASLVGVVTAYAVARRIRGTERQATPMS